MDGTTEFTVESWLSEKGLARFQDNLKKMFAIETLEDIQDLTDDDLDIICSDLQMKLGERNRFRKEVKKFQSRQDVDKTESDEKENTNMQQENTNMHEVLVEVTKAKLDERIVVPHEERIVEPHDVSAEVYQVQYGSFGQILIADFEWFEVLQNMVFIKSAPNKDAEGIGIVRKGQKIQVEKKRVVDQDLHEWVVLTPVQFQHSCQSDEADHGFALVDGTHLGLGKLLHGPTAPDFPVQQPQLPPANDTGKLRMLLEEFENDLPMKRQEQQEQDLEELKAEKRFQLYEQEQASLGRKWNIEQDEMRMALELKLVVYRVARRITYIREAEDPSSATHVQVSCKVGRCIFSTGKEWVDESDGLWVQKYSKNLTKPCWFYVGSLSGADEPCLIKEVERIHIAISWCNYRGQELVFSMYMNKLDLVRTLKMRFCQETQLKPKWTIFLTKTPNQPEGKQVGTILEDDRTITSYGYEHKADLCLSYVGEFEEDYMEGKLSKVEL